MDAQQEKKAAERMQMMATTVLSPVYPVIAADILMLHGKKNGVFLDIGGGTGQLAVAMAKCSEFKVISLDISQEMTRLAEETIRTEKLESRVTAIVGDAAALPFKNESVDLIMSRGSSFAWHDKVGAFREIARVLRKGGRAYIGVGCIFGSEELREKIVAHFRATDPEWDKGAEERENALSFADVDHLCKAAGIDEYVKMQNGSDKWIVIER